MQIIELIMYNMNIYLKITSVILLIVSSLFVYPQSSNNTQHLLTINRSRDADIIKYELNVDDNGNIDLNDPIQIYWLRRTQQNQKEELTWIQNKYAYGIKLIDKSNKNYEHDSNIILRFKFVSYNNAILEVRKDFNNNYKLYTVFQNQEIDVSNIHIQFNGGTFWVPIISEVRINGFKPHSDELVSTIINP